MSEELQALREDLAACQEEIAKINEEFFDLKPEKEAAAKAAVEIGKRMKALSESTRVPIARSEGLRSKIARLEKEEPDEPEEKEEK